MVLDLASMKIGRSQAMVALKLVLDSEAISQEEKTSHQAPDSTMPQSTTFVHSLARVASSARTERTAKSEIVAALLLGLIILVQDPMEMITILVALHTQWVLNSVIKMTTGNRPLISTSLILDPLRVTHAPVGLVVVTARSSEARKTGPVQEPTASILDQLNRLLTLSEAQNALQTRTSAILALDSIMCHTTWLTYLATRCQTNLTSGGTSETFLNTSIIL